MQVCQWQVVQINPAARALALGAGGRRGTGGAGAAGGAWITVTPVVCPPGPGPGSGAADAGAGRQPAEDGGAAGDPRETDTDSEMLDGPGGRGGSPAPDDPVHRLYNLYNVLHTSVQFVQYCKIVCKRLEPSTTSLQFVQSQNNLHSFVCRCTILFKFLRDCLNCTEVARNW